MPPCNPCVDALVYNQNLVHSTTSAHACLHTKHTAQYPYYNQNPVHSSRTCQVDPLDLGKHNFNADVDSERNKWVQQLDISNYGFTEADLDKVMSFDIISKQVSVC
jgi:hypothetical protein